MKSYLAGDHPDTWRVSHARLALRVEALETKLEAVLAANRETLLEPRPIQVTWSEPNPMGIDWSGDRPDQLSLPFPVHT